VIPDTPLVGPVHVIVAETDYDTDADVLPNIIPVNRSSSTAARNDVSATYDFGGATRSGFVRKPLIRSADLNNDVNFDDINRTPEDPSTLNEAVCLAALMTDVMSSTIPFDPQVAFMSTANNFATLKTPKSYAEALASPQATEWLKSMEEEYNSLVINNTWEIVPSPNAKFNLVGSKWVYLIKFNPDGSVKRFKSRLVAQGFSQKFNIDYFDTYAPVVAMTTIRIMLATACHFGWDVHQLDVETAFLNASVTEVIYLRSVPGYDIGVGNVLRLKKSLYGLKQSPYNWNCAVHEWLDSIGYRRNSVDACLYEKVDKGSGKKVIVTLYVDDLLITGDWITEIASFKVALKTRFKIKDLGLIEHCLGLYVQRDMARQTMLINQSHYIDQLLIRFDMEHCKYSKVPAEKSIAVVNSTWHNDKGLSYGETALADFPYRELVGCLLFVALSTRPDITNAVRSLAKFSNSAPDKPRA
jgi:hypothetical protein